LLTLTNISHQLSQNPLLEKATVVDKTTAGASTSITATATALSAAVSQTSTNPSTTKVQSIVQRNRKKVPFEKGYSQMDWIRLTNSGTDLTGLGKGVRPRKDIPLSEIAQHNTAEDGWTVLRGKVYNLSPYMRFHPGGEKILKPILGKDGTALFNRYHAWVNAEFLLAKCMVGTVGTVETSSSKDGVSGCASALL
jgi:cytochrome b involved in lipid metabolism